MNGFTTTTRLVDRFFDFRGFGKWLLVGGVLGVVAGLAAILFQMTLETLRTFCFRTLMGLDLGHPGGEPPDFTFPLAASMSPLWILVLPALGGLLAGLLVRQFAPEARGHGTDAAIHAYHARGGHIRKRVPTVKFLATILTMGTGGSGGREGPIAQIGAGLGSFLANRLGFGARNRRILMAAGLGAGVGAIFRAPLAGALFATEVLYSDPEIETEVLLPAAVTSIVAYSVYTARYGFGQMFTTWEPFTFTNPLELGPYLVLAVVVAGAALLYIRVFYGTESLFRRLGIPEWTKPVLGGFLTGALALALYFWVQDLRVFDVMSTGYGVLQDVMSGSLAKVGIGVLVLISLGKIVTTSLTIGSGGSAGVFGPSMVIGGTLGAAVGQGFHAWIPGIVSHPGSFAVVGMAGFFTAAAKTPLSTIIMVSEMTGSYELLVPTMWVCALAFLVSRRWTIYRSQVPSRVFSPAHFGDYAMEIMGHTEVGDVFRKERRWISIPTDLPIRDILRLTAETRQRVYPVVDVNGQLVGTFHQGDLMQALHDEYPENPDPRAKDLIPRMRLHLFASDNLSMAQRLMSSRGVDELVVCHEDGRVAGILASSDVLTAYNQRLSQGDGDTPPEAPEQGSGLS